MDNKLWDIEKLFGLYSISKTGEVFSKRNNIFLKQFLRNGYPAVHVSINGKPKIFSVHRLVAETFIPNPSSMPMVNHINAIKLDNRAENLEWTTPKRNSEHASKRGLYKFSEKTLSAVKINVLKAHQKTRKLDAAAVEIIKASRKLGKTFRELGAQFNISESCIYDICRGSTYKESRHE